MAYLGWQAASEQKFGKGERTQLACLFAHCAAPAIVFPLLGGDWVVGLEAGIVATCFVGPLAYNKTSEILRNRSVGITKGSKVVKAVQASAYAAVLASGLAVGQVDKPEGKPVNIETGNVVSEFENNSLIPR